MVTNRGTIFFLVAGNNLIRDVLLNRVQISYRTLSTQLLPVSQDFASFIKAHDVVDSAARKIQNFCGAILCSHILPIPIFNHLVQVCGNIHYQLLALCFQGFSAEIKWLRILVVSAIVLRVLCSY